MKTKTILCSAALMAALISGGCRHALPQAELALNELDVAPQELMLIGADDRSNEPLVESEGFNGAVVEELFALLTQQRSSTAMQPHERPGPSLIAGDWLALECAFAGGYLMPEQKMGTPVFAEVPESWFGLKSH